jgi:hypothetical protein
MTLCWDDLLWICLEPDMALDFKNFACCARSRLLSWVRWYQWGSCCCCWPLFSPEENEPSFKGLSLPLPLMLPCLVSPGGFSGTVSICRGWHPDSPYVRFFFIKSGENHNR